MSRITNSTATNAREPDREPDHLVRGDLAVPAIDHDPEQHRGAEPAEQDRRGVQDRVGAARHGPDGEPSGDGEHEEPHAVRDQVARDPVVQPEALQRVGEDRRGHTDQEQEQARPPPRRRSRARSPGRVLLRLRTRLRDVAPRSATISSSAASRLSTLMPVAERVPEPRRDRLAPRWRRPGSPGRRATVEPQHRDRDALEDRHVFAGDAHVPPRVEPRARRGERGGERRPPRSRRRSR